MKLLPARTERADQPPSTDGTATGRARRWPLRAGVLAVAAIAVAAPMVAAEPAAAPERSVVAAPEPASAVDETVRPGDAFDGLGDVATVAGAVTANAADRVDVTPPPPPPPPPTTTTTTAPPPPPTTAAPAAPSGRCGGNLPPCWVMMRESGGDIRAQNPRSSASGKWQFIRSTWAGYGGYAEAHLAPESVQDAKAAELWAGGAGCGHWNAC